MLRAIAIYNVSINYQLICQNHSSRSNSIFSKTNITESLDHEMIKEAVDNLYIVSKKINNDFIYTKYFDTDGIIVCLLSKKELFDHEPHYFLHNAKCIYLQGSLLNVTLDDMLANPLAYISKDVRTGTIQFELDDLKFYLLNNVVSNVNIRGELLSSLEEKTFKLSEQAEEFNRKSKELNRCCKWW